MKKFEVLNYGIPVGSSLRAGYYLLGGVRAKGLGELGVLAGGANQMDYDNLQGLVQFLVQCALMPAMDHVSRGGDRSGQQRRVLRHLSASAFLIV